MTGIQNFLKTGDLPDAEGEEKKIHRLTPVYLIIIFELYKRGYSTPCRKCLTQSEKVLKEVHEGVVAC